VSRAQGHLPDLGGDNSKATFGLILCGVWGGWVTFNTRNKVESVFVLLENGKEMMRWNRKIKP
jgi:hypothetical protein